MGPIKHQETLAPAITILVPIPGDFFVDVDNTWFPLIHMEDTEAAPLSQITVWHSFMLILTIHKNLPEGLMHLYPQPLMQLGACRIFHR